MLEARDKLFEVVFKALEKDIEDNMGSALTQLRVNNPEKYLEVVGMFLFEAFNVTKSKDIENGIGHVFKQLETTIEKVAATVR